MQIVLLHDSSFMVLMLVFVTCTMWKKYEMKQYFWIQETYFDSRILSDDRNLEIPGYDLIRADHPSNSKRGGVCVYYRN